MTTLAPQPLPSTPRPAPPLQPGDHLSRDEFERRYDATPGLKKAELIEGKVHKPPPVSHDHHSKPHSDLVGLLFVYRAATAGVTGGDNGSLRLDLDNMPQPDAYLLIEPRYGGQAAIDADGYITGAPELIAEIAASSASYDLHEKLNVYRRNGVREYIVWRTFDREIDYFILRQTTYVRHAPDADGIYHSEAFPGLRIAPAPLIDGDLAETLRLLQQGLGAPEHQRFIRQLATHQQGDAN